jgi:HD-like signal output (HDOD) protein
VFAFLQNLFGRVKDAPKPVAEPISTRPSLLPLKLEESDSATPAGPHPFDSVWKLLTIDEIPFPPRFSAEEVDQVAAIVPKVLTHYTEHRPDPASFPALAMQIVRMSHESDLEMKSLVRTIGMDPAISMHILRVANSAFYRRNQEIQDLRRAVLHIGMQEAVNIASAVAARSLFDVNQKAESKVYGPLWNRMFMDTMAVAFGASAFTFELQVGRADHAFLSGMFHDIGKSVALRSLADLIHAGQVEPPNSDGVVDEVLERVHVEVGGDLHLLWRLPDYLTRSCLRHHDFGLPTSMDFWDIHVLRLAEGFHRLLLNPGNCCGLHETRQSLQALRLSYLSALRLYVLMKEEMERVQLLFGA